MLKIREEKAQKMMQEMYPVGTRVRLVKMEDKFTTIPIGTEGTVTGVDAIGSLLIDWDCPSSLHVLFGEDEVEIISKPLYQLIETVEGSDGVRDYYIIYSNFDKKKVIDRMKEQIQEDEYGLIARNGIEDDSEEHFKTKFDAGFQKWEVVSTVISY